MTERPSLDAAVDTCPTCGSSVTVSTSGEGTSFYVPVDRPREPSPELREKVAEALWDHVANAGGNYPWSREEGPTHEYWQEAAAAVLAVLREEQG